MQRSAFWHRRANYMDPSERVRESAVQGLATSREPSAIQTVVGIAKNDKSVHIRGKALFWLAQQAGEKATAAIKDAIQKLASGVSPMHASIPGFPFQIDERTASSMKDQMTAIAAFQASMRAARALPRSQRMKRAQELVAVHGIPPMTPLVALEKVNKHFGSLHVLVDDLQCG